MITLIVMTCFFMLAPTGCLVDAWYGQRPYAERIEWLVLYLTGSLVLVGALIARFGGFAVWHKLASLRHGPNGSFWWVATAILIFAAASPLFAAFVYTRVHREREQYQIIAA